MASIKEIRYFFDYCRSPDTVTLVCSLSADRLSRISGRPVSKICNLPYNPVCCIRIHYFPNSPNLILNKPPLLVFINQKKCMLTKLKARLNIKSNFQFLLIMVVFSITGSASLLVRKAVFEWIGITADTSLWIRVPLYLLIIFPAYQIIFLLVGSLFGQFRFAWEFEKKIFSRLMFKK